MLSCTNVQHCCCAGGAQALAAAEACYPLPAAQKLLAGTHVRSPAAMQRLSCYA